MPSSRRNMVNFPKGISREKTDGGTSLQHFAMQPIERIFDAALPVQPAPSQLTTKRADIPECQLPGFPPESQMRAVRGKGQAGKVCASLRGLKMGKDGSVGYSDKAGHGSLAEGDAAPVRAECRLRPAALGLGGQRRTLGPVRRVQQKAPGLTLTQDNPRAVGARVDMGAVPVSEGATQLARPGIAQFERRVAALQAVRKHLVVVVDKRSPCRPL